MASLACSASLILFSYVAALQGICRRIHNLSPFQAQIPALACACRMPMKKAAGLVVLRFRDMTPIMVNQTEPKAENQMETGIGKGFTGISDLEFRV